MLIFRETGLFYLVPTKGTCPWVIFSCPVILSITFQFLIKINYRKIKYFLALKLSYIVFIMLINVKMSTIVGILTFYEQNIFHAQVRSA